MTRLTRNLLAGSCLALLLATPAAYGQIDVTWVAGTGDWNTGSNWTGNGGFAPEGGFGEQAIINNGGVAQLSTPYLNTGGVLGGPGNLILAQSPGDSGTLEMTGTGELLLEPGANVNRFVDVGAGDIGNGGTGTLLMSDSSRLQMNNFFSGGQLDSLVSLSDSATIFAENDITFRAVTRTVGSGVSVEATNNLTFGGQQTYVPQITGSSHSTLVAGGTATLNGTLSLEFDGYSPSVGDTWDLVSASNLNGAFSSIEVASGYTLGAGQEFIINNVTVDDTTVAQLTLVQSLALLVDRDTGAVSISNPGDSAVSLDSYQISSSVGSLGGAWNSLDDQFAGWDEAPNSSATDLVELNAESSLAIGATSTQTLGTPYSPNYSVFGQSPEEGLTFTYRDVDTGALVEGEVVLTGGNEVFNNLVLTIDPTTGEASLGSDSPTFVVDVDGYTITSSTGSLQPGNWNSLDDQGVQGDTWDDDSSAASSDALIELNPSDATAFSDGTAFSLGAIFNTSTGLTEGDISFEYILEGETEVRTGAVLFAALTGTVTGDYNNDGVVDAADYTVWRDAEGTMTALPNDPIGGEVGQDQYDQWVANFGQSVSSNSQAIPEPNSLLLACLATFVARVPSRRRG